MSEVVYETMNYELMRQRSNESMTQEAMKQGANESTNQWCIGNKQIYVSQQISRPINEPVSQ